MLGHAVADALGVPAEFRPRSYFDKKPVTDMTGYGTHNMPAGCWSDDTSMSIAALDVLADGRLDYAEIMQNFLGWLRNNEYNAADRTFDIGKSCMHSILKYERGVAPLDCGDNGEYANGNGSLMRIHPFALYLYYNRCAEEPFDVIHKASMLTHAHERAVIGCGIYSAVLWELLSSPTKKSVYVGLRKAKEIYLKSPEVGSYERLFERIGNKAEIDKIERCEIKSTGYVVDSLEAAIWCLLTSENYSECVLRAVNLGDDTDTVAAIAGGLAGALYGPEGIPEGWLRALMSREKIEEMCTRATKNWTFRK